VSRVQRNVCPREYRIDGRIPSNWKAHHRAVVRENAQLAREAAARTVGGRRALALLIQACQAPATPRPAPAPDRKCPTCPRLVRPCVICPEEQCEVCGW